MTPTRSQLADELNTWANDVDPADLITLDTSALQAVCRLAALRESVEAELTQAVRTARAANRSWSQIGAMLGVSKQAAQRRYAKSAQAAYE